MFLETLVRSMIRKKGILVRQGGPISTVGSHDAVDDDVMAQVVVCLLARWFRAILVVTSRCSTTSAQRCLARPPSLDPRILLLLASLEA